MSKPPAICRQCCLPFTPARPWALYCSRRCATAWKRMHRVVKETKDARYRRLLQEVAAEEKQARVRIDRVAELWREIDKLKPKLKLK